MKKNLQLNHTRQRGRTYCGVACLEMVFDYFGKKVDQNDIWVRKKVLRPDRTASYVTSESMAMEARDQGLNVIMAQSSLNAKKCKGNIERMISLGIPIIVCRQWENDSDYGHFVIIVGVDGNIIKYLDPEKGSRIRSQNFLSFLNSWRKTGEEVLGGFFIAITDKKTIGKRLHLNQFNIYGNFESFCLEVVKFV